MSHIVLVFPFVDFKQVNPGWIMAWKKLFFGHSSLQELRKFKASSPVILMNKIFNCAKNLQRNVMKGYNNTQWITYEGEFFRNIKMILWVNLNGLLENKDWAKIGIRNSRGIPIRKRLGSNPLTHNVSKWSDSKCCKIFKVCLIILGHYTLKG